MKLSILLFLSAIAASDAARSMKTRGRHENDEQTTGIDRELRGKGGKGGKVFKQVVGDYEDPPAGLVPGDVVTDCSIKLTDDLDCRGRFDCVTLDATDGDVELDCGGHTIGSYFSEQESIGIYLQGCNGNTITVKNCIVTGFNTCIEADDNDAGCRDINVVIEDSAAIGCTFEGMDFRHDGDVTLVEAVATGNGHDGIRFSSQVDNVVLDEVFACGNGKDDRGDHDIDFDGTPTNLETMDVTTDLLAGPAFATIPCPRYESPSCVDVNAADDNDS